MIHLSLRCLVALGLSIVSGLGQPAIVPSADASKGAAASLQFGPAVHGLSAALELAVTNGEVFFDQPIEVHIHIRNETNYDIQVASETFRQGDKVFIETEKGRPALNEWGQPVMWGSAFFSGWPRTRREVLKPGEIMVLRTGALIFRKANGQTSPVASHSAHVRPGRYRIRFRLDFNGRIHNAEAADWGGSLETAALNLQVKAPDESSSASNSKDIGLPSSKEATNAIEQTPDAPDAHPVTEFEGRVVDDKTSLPVTNFIVQPGRVNPNIPTNIFWSRTVSGPCLGTTVTDRKAGNCFSVMHHEPGQICARVVAEGYLPQLVTPKPIIAPGQKKSLTVRLKRGVELQGLVVDYEGNPLPQAGVFLAGNEWLQLTNGRPHSYYRDSSAITDSNGRFVLRAANAGTHKLVIFVPEFLDARLTVKFDGSAETRVTLPKPGRLLVRYNIPGEDSKARLSLYGDGSGADDWRYSGFELTPVITNGAELVLTNLLPGTYEIARTKRLGERDSFSWPCDRQKISLGAGQTTSVEIVRTIGYPIAGEILDLDQLDLDSCMVCVGISDGTPPSELVMSRLSDVLRVKPDGTFETGLLKPGLYDLVALATVGPKKRKERSRKGDPIRSFKGTANVRVTADSRPPPVQIQLKLISWSPP